MKAPKNKIAIKCAYTELVGIDALRPHPKNPNKHPPKQIALLAKLIRRVGMRQRKHSPGPADAKVVYRTV